MGIGIAPPNRSPIHPVNDKFIRPRDSCEKVGAQAMRTCNAPPVVVRRIKILFEVGSSTAEPTSSLKDPSA